VFGGAGGEHFAVHIAQRGEFRGLISINGTDVTAAAAAEAHGAALEGFVGPIYLGPALCGPSHRGAGVKGGLEE
ncbi:uncharacterized protein METZ01_LOCUS406337, partial [marine metagenome]